MATPLDTSGKEGKAPMDLDFDLLFKVDFDTAIMECMECETVISTEQSDAQPSKQSRHAGRKEIG